MGVPSVGGGVHDVPQALMKADGELMTATTEQRIFISYRRSDSQSQANGLNDGLRHRMQNARVFMDIDSIPIGADFEEHIRGEIEQCQVALILIGDNWLDPRPGTDVRRIDESNDFVRLEVESALKAKHMRVIPVLVEGARMPTPEELPKSIQRLARLNAFELSDSRWSSDLARLTEQLGVLIGTTKASASSAPSRTMSFADVDDDALRYAISSLPHTFATKDVSEHPAVLATHTEVSQLGNYHTMIGRYLMQHRSSLGLGEPGTARGDRGAVWTKNHQASAYTAPPPRPSYPTPQVAAPPARFAPPPPAAAPVQPQKKARSTRAMILWCVLTLGFASWAAPIWAANRRPHDKAFRRRMHLLAAGMGAAIVLATILTGTAPEDAEGAATGPLADFGGTIILLSMVVGIVVVVAFRRPTTPLAGTQSVLARRESRDRYRRLVEQDRPLARSMHVGRPDVPRDYDDGGLVDLNSVPPSVLAHHAGVEHDEAARIVEMRGQLGRFVSVDEVLVYVDLPEPSASRLRDVAVFV